MTLTLVLIDSTVTGTRLVEISVIRMVSCEVDKMVSGMVSVVVLSFLIVLIDTLEKIIVLGAKVISRIFVLVVVTGCMVTWIEVRVLVVSKVTGISTVSVEMLYL